MILNGRQNRLPNLDTVMEFRVVGSIPLNATLSWLKDTEQPELGTNEKVVAVEDLGNSIFSFTAFVPAQSFWVKLNTEDRKMLFDNVYKSVAETDRPLAYVGNPDNFSLYVPYCDPGSINVEVFTVDGVKLDTFGNTTKFWDHFATVIFDGYNKPRLCLELVFFRMQLKQGAGPWQDQGAYSSFYVKVSGMKNIITNDILLTTIVESSDYSVEYQDKKDKTRSKGTSWGVTVKY